MLLRPGEVFPSGGSSGDPVLGGDVRCFLSGIPQKNFHECLVVG